MHKDWAHSEFQPKIFVEHHQQKFASRLQDPGSLTHGLGDVITPQMINGAGADNGVPFIADWMKSETREVELGPIERMWSKNPVSLNLPFNLNSEVEEAAVVD